MTASRRARLEALLTQAWQRRGLLACALWPLGLLMSTLVHLRRLAYRLGWLRAETLPRPVIVVGNRVAGGAGKTPTTLALLTWLKHQGWRPGVLTRGYGAHIPTDPASGQACRLLDAQSAPHLTATDTGDEPLLIWRRAQVPVMIGRDRASGGHALLRAHPEVDVLVCDDGLQHLQLARNVEIVVFDERGAGNGWLLPAGPLREPADCPSGASDGRPPLVLYNAPAPSTLLPGHLAHRTLMPPQRLEDWAHGAPVKPDQAQPPKEAPLLAAAGIAQPERFFSALRVAGWQVSGLPLADHDDWSTLPWPADAPHVVVTEKDAVKLDVARVRAERPHTQVWVAALHFAPDPDFWQALASRMPPPPALH